MSPEIERLQTLIEAELPAEADAIVWLQGDRFDRGARVLELFKNGVAPRIILTGNNALIGKGARRDEENISVDDMAEWLLEQGVPEMSVVRETASMNTHDQAVHVLSLAKRGAWRRIILVGSLHHQARPFLVFLKQARDIGWDGDIVNQPNRHPAWNEVPSGRTKTAREYFAEEIVKLETYAAHTASVADGIAHIMKRQ
jgi:uncharacterized SAM-binding protein YcdF (DUF218 family)